jgi:hypothetical protein
VLLSDAFAVGHCFRAVAPSADSGRLAAWIGIAFAPVRPRAGVAEVEGVLWLDRATAELREFAYRYVSLPDDARLAERAGAGGRVEFLRLPNGGWIVDRWSIRLPLVAGSARAASVVVPGVQRDAAPAAELAGVKIAGGEVSEVRRGETVLWARGRVALRVRVVDAERGAPVADAVVELDSTSAVAADDGVATLLRVLPGAHELRVHTPALDLLRAAPPPRPVLVAEASPEPLVVTMPSERAALAAACGARAAEWEEAALRGTVRGTVPNGAPDDAPRVEATWRVSYVRLGGGEPIVVTERREAAVDARGEYALCGVPRDVDLFVRARRGAAAGPPLVVRVPPRAVAQAADPSLP